MSRDECGVAKCLNIVLTVTDARMLNTIAIGFTPGFGVLVVMTTVR